ncbi:hypothetical protein ACLKA6_004475 [Drosophila palustris]
MSTPKNFGLGQFALQNVRAQSGLGQVCNLYKSRTATSVASAARNNCNHNGGRISKLIGVKKTLVNQMQGMSQGSRPKIKSRALSLATSSKYSIYGQTKLFSSMSSLHGRSSSSSGMSPSLNHRRCLSHIGPRANPVRYIVHQRYHQTGKLQEKRNEDIARDISQAIKSELMDVDSDTKRLISCTKSRYANAKSNSNAAAEQEENEAEEEGEQQVPTKKFSYDPLEGWNHPRAVKTTDAIKYAEDEDDLIRQCKPLRRKSRNIRYKDESNNVSVVSQQFVQPSRKLQSQLDQLHKTTKNNKVGQRKHHDQDQDHDHDADELMPVPSKNQDKFAENNNNYDREDGDRSMWSSKRNDGDLGRMDEQHYQSKMAANLMSASQRVINKQFEGYRKEMSDSRNKLKQIKLVKNMVKAVNPLPLTKASRLPGVPKYRPKMVRSKESLQASFDKTKSKAMAMAKAKATSKSAAQLWKRKKSETATILDRYGQDYVDKLLDKPKRSHSVLPYEKPIKKCVSDNRHIMPQVQKGEKRRNQKASDETYANDNLQNAMQMPVEYSKESAVQRLGTLVEKRATSFFQQSQQRARH